MRHLAVLVLAVLAGSVGGVAAREGAFCGGIAGRSCAAGEYCAYSPGLCPRVVKDASGICKPVVAACEAKGPAVCGCDGRTYANACEAEQARAFVKHEGAC